MFRTRKWYSGVKLGSFSAAVGTVLFELRLVKRNEIWPACPAYLQMSVQNAGAIDRSQSNGTPPTVGEKMAS
ncbi:MAG: hypothetical protein GY820_30610 [Gammaproteobacteria bacterium]|nr:hypothetical protein [Gammaproteobacteria bacterium]